MLVAETFFPPTKVCFLLVQNPSLISTTGCPPSQLRVQPCRRWQALKEGQPNYCGGPPLWSLKESRRAHTGEGRVFGARLPPPPCDGMRLSLSWAQWDESEIKVWKHLTPSHLHIFFSLFYFSTAPITASKSLYAPQIAEEMQAQIDGHIGSPGHQATRCCYAIRCYWWQCTLWDSYIKPPY
jgi:hypothetical protein